MKYKTTHDAREVYSHDVEHVLPLFFCNGVSKTPLCTFPPRVNFTGYQEHKLYEPNRTPCCALQSIPTRVYPEVQPSYDNVGIFEVTHTVHIVFIKVLKNNALRVMYLQRINT
jgi:hypothetical protein